MRSGCTCPGSSYKTESCGNSCQNGGTARSNDCSCRSGFIGQCCQTSKTQYTDVQCSLDNILAMFYWYTCPFCQIYILILFYYSFSGVTCGNPGSPQHGSVTPAGNTHYYNTQAHYSCDSGWEISGGTNPRTCQNNGLWSGSISGCTSELVRHLSFSRYAFLSDYLTDLKLHSTK